jgi:hypothetical protein
MGIKSTIGKLVFFPFYIPYKMIKKHREENKPFPINSAVETRNPAVYQYYLEGIGLETNAIRTKGGTALVLAWNKGVSDKDKGEILTKLAQVV